MEHMLKPLLIILLLAGCTAATDEGSEPSTDDPGTGGDSAFYSDPNATTNTEPNTHADTNADTHPGIDGGRGAGIGRDANAGTGGERGAGPDADANPGADTDPYTNSDGNMDVEPVSDAGMNTDSAPEPDASSDTNAGPVPRLLAEDIWRQVRRVNDYWILAHEDPGPNTWDRATYFSADMVAYTTFSEPQYREYSENWAVGHGWGLNDGVATRNADNHCAGQTYLALYQLDPSPEKMADIRTSISAMVSSNRRDDWWWIDALHMAMPVFAALGNLTGDGRYRQAMYEFYADTKNRRGLYNESDHLWYRDGSFMPPNRTPSGADIYWSRGNGWVFAALAKTLNLLPEDDPHRGEYTQVFQEMADELSTVQQPDGFYYTSLHDPSQLGGPESSGTGFFTYGMAWGINNGLLDRGIFESVVVRAWEALNETAVHPDGKLGYCQRIDVGPGPSGYDDYTDYGVGAFILAGCEVFKLFEGSLPDDVTPRSVASFSSEERGNEAVNAVDGNVLTRWSASGYPQTIELDLGGDTPIHTIEVHGYQNRAYQYTVAGMAEGGAFEVLVDRSDNSAGGKVVDRFETVSVRHIRITVTGSWDYGGEWISISDVRVLGSR